MGIFNLHVSYLLVLVLNQSVGLRIRPMSRRYDPGSDPASGGRPYRGSAWYSAATKRLSEDAYPSDADDKPFLDLDDLKAVLGLHFDSYDDDDLDTGRDPEPETLPEDSNGTLPESGEDYMDTGHDDLVADLQSEPSEGRGQPGQGQPGQGQPGQGEGRSFRYSILLDTKGDFKLEWDIDDVTELIYFRLMAVVDKSDLFGFGFSDFGEVSSADVIVLWTNHSGNHMIQDAHTDTEGRLQADKSQDYILDDVSIQNGRLNLYFHRAYDTCDTDDYLIDTGTIHMIFFTSPGPIDDLENVDLSNVKVEVQRVQLIKSQLPDAEMPDDVDEFVMHVDKVKIPAVETTYWMAVRKLPLMKEKHHIIKYEGYVSPQSVGLVHHMEVFHCDVSSDKKLPFFDGPNEAKSERPEGLESCRHVIGAWAMGAQALTYPEEAGAPIGGPGYSRYVMLEIHYNNPEHKQGVIDSSGIKFYVTKRLRKYDAGTMEVGLEYTDKMALPPGLASWSLVGYCVAECTKVGLPEGGIKVFASQLHTHLTGRVTYTRHYRNGIELPNINRDNHYSPHYQEIRKLRRQVTVLPGDVLVHICEDRTIDKENVTLGGFSISDEMCINYLHYYPRTSLEVCKSSVTTHSLHGFFKFMNVYNHQKTSPDLGFSDNYKSIDWSPLNVQLLQTYYDTAPLSVQCNQSDGNRFPGYDWEGMPVPKPEFARPPEERPCLL